MSEYHFLLSFYILKISGQIAWDRISYPKHFETWICVIKINVLSLVYVSAFVAELFTLHFDTIDRKMFFFLVIWPSCDLDIE